MTSATFWHAKRALRLAGAKRECNVSMSFCKPVESLYTRISRYFPLKGPKGRVINHHPSFLHTILNTFCNLDKRKV